MRIRLLLPVIVAAAGLVALIATGVLAQDAWLCHTMARDSGRAVAAFGKVLRAWEAQQLERRALGIGLSLPKPDRAAATRAGEATDRAFDVAVQALSAMRGTAQQQAAVQDARSRLAAARHAAAAELSKPLEQRAAAASSNLLRDFNRVQAAMGAPATAAEAAAGRAEPSISQAVLIARIAAALRESLGARSTLLSLHLSGKRLTPAQLVEATEYTGQVAALWERIGVAVQALDNPPGLTSAIAETETMLMGTGERTYRSLLAQARGGADAGPPGMSFAEFRAFTEPMLAQPIALRDAALAEAERIAAKRAHDADRALLLSTFGIVLGLGIVVTSVLLVIRRVAEPLEILATEVQRLADGNLDNTASATARRDEIGTVARAVEGLRLRLIDARRADAELATQAERETDRLRQLVNSAMEGILLHREGMVLDANIAFCRLAGLPLSDVRGQSMAALFGRPALAGGWQPPDGTAVWINSVEPQELELAASDGSIVPVEALVRDATYKGMPAQVLAVRDIRERRAAEAQIRHLAHHDGLTGLANRILFNDRISIALATAERKHDCLAVLCLDLDRFKPVNDTYGHAVGDLLLQQVADRLRAATRASDTVARLGGDEFVVLQSGSPQPRAAADLSQRIVDALSAPYALGEHTITIGTSIGIALYPADGLTGTDLLSRADIALYRAKGTGGSTFKFYNQVGDVRPLKSFAKEIASITS